MQHEGCERIIRNAKGEFVAGFFFKVKMEGLVYIGLKFAWEKGKRKIFLNQMLLNQ